MVAHGNRRPENPRHGGTHHLDRLAGRPESLRLAEQIMTFGNALAAKIRSVVLNIRAGEDRQGTPYVRRQPEYGIEPVGAD